MTELHRDSFPAGQYFLAVAGLAVMRRILSRPSEGLARVAEMRDIAANYGEFPNNIEIEVIEHGVDDGYNKWAPIYDGPNPAIEAEEPAIQAMFANLPVGDALDAACGTGRLAGHLARLGHNVTGVDATAGMLDVAREQHPSVRFEQGQLEALPVADASVDAVVSGLAVCHTPDLDAVFAEFARVTRPGGSIIVSDPHPSTVQLGGVAGFRDPEADPTEGFAMPFVRNLHHPMHTYINAAAGAGLEVVECQEPTFTEAGLATNPAFAILPDAVRQAFDGMPLVVVWRFRKPA